MQARITNSLIPRIRPSDRPYEIRDTNLKGFLLRVQPSGAMSYYVEYAWGKRVRLGRAETLSPAKAREEAKAVLSEVYAGKDPAAARRAARAHTLESFVDEVYAPWADANLRTANATVARLKRSFPELQSMALGDVTPWLVEKWRAARLKSGTKPTTVNRDLDDLKSTMNKAAQWGFLETNPITSVRRSRVDHAPRVRYLSEDEENSLRSALRDRDAQIRSGRSSANAWRRERGYPEHPMLDNCPFVDHLEPMVLVSLNTGLRQGELFDLDWHDLDLSSASLTVRGSNAKSGNPRHLPLNAEALRVLKGWRNGALDPSGLVFPGRERKLSWTGGKTPQQRAAILARRTKDSRDREVSLARPAPHLRIQPRHERRRLEHRARTARARELPDDASLRSPRTRAQGRGSREAPPAGANHVRR